jgi:hypothetical protein
MSRTFGETFSGSITDVPSSLARWRPPIVYTATCTLQHCSLALSHSLRLSWYSKVRTSVQEPHNVMALAPVVQRFTLLPIPAADSTKETGTAPFWYCIPPPPRRCFNALQQCLRLLPPFRRNWFFDAFGFFFSLSTRD